MFSSSPGSAKVGAKTAAIFLLPILPGQLHIGPFQGLLSYALRKKVGLLKTLGLDPPEIMVAMDQSGYQISLLSYLGADVMGLVTDASLEFWVVKLVGTCGWFCLTTGCKSHLCHFLVLWPESNSLGSLSIRFYSFKWGENTRLDHNICLVSFFVLYEAQALADSWAGLAVSNHWGPTRTCGLFLCGLYLANHPG